MRTRKEENEKQDRREREREKFMRITICERVLKSRARAVHA